MATLQGIGTDALGGLGGLFAGYNNVQALNQNEVDYQKSQEELQKARLANYLTQQTQDSLIKKDNASNLLEASKAGALNNVGYLGALNQGSIGQQQSLAAKGAVDMGTRDTSILLGNAQNRQKAQNAEFLQMHNGIQEADAMFKAGNGLGAISALDNIPAGKALREEALKRGMSLPDVVSRVSAKYADMAKNYKIDSLADENALIHGRNNDAALASASLHARTSQDMTAVQMAKETDAQAQDALAKQEQLVKQAMNNPQTQLQYMNEFHKNRTDLESEQGKAGFESYIRERIQKDPTYKRLQLLEQQKRAERDEWAKRVRGGIGILGTPGSVSVSTKTKQPTDLSEANTSGMSIEEKRAKVKALMGQ